MMALFQSIVSQVEPDRGWQTCSYLLGMSQVRAE